ncbi:hypothetical protein V496_02074 [Neofusicoccum parvum]|uniref:Uncharacterized protein n=1 Tax=Neofusicoccum parvum TaxID=310453 RepID=A0ACB5SES5_9PEZI|nr:hypothetical protein V496_02074 [Neofusicoccum parvum]
MRKFIPFRQSAKGGKSPEQAEESYQKRREQVRRAQRTHRERKEAYVKSIETEVLQLRTSEARLLQENRTLHAEVDRLRQKLADHAIDASPPPPAHASPVVSVGRDDASHAPRLFVQQPGAASGETPRSAATSPSSAAASEAELTQLGLNFVLTLESPCLPHAHDHGGARPDPTGHALTASAALLARCPRPDDPLALPPADAVAWETTSAGLERLLDLSGRIDTDGELTPVQAWDYIRCHPRFAELRDAERLWSLTTEVAREVKCAGFGAVIDQEVFERIVERACSGGGT